MIRAQHENNVHGCVSLSELSKIPKDEREGWGGATFPASTVEIQECDFTGK